MAVKSIYIKDDHDWIGGNDFTIFTRWFACETAEDECSADHPAKMLTFYSWETAVTPVTRWLDTGCCRSATWSHGPGGYGAGLRRVRYSRLSALSESPLLRRDGDSGLMISAQP